MTDLQRMMFFLTLAMIHPTCLHLCTNLLSKARKGDAIHPALFYNIIDYQNVRKTEFLGCQSQEWCFCSVIWPDFTEINPNFSAGLFRTLPDNVGLPKKSQSPESESRVRVPLAGWGEGRGRLPWKASYWISIKRDTLLPADMTWRMVR